VTFEASDEGKTFRYMLEAKNEIGSVFSPIGSQLLAGVPGKPQVLLRSDPEVTNGQRIKVIWQEPADNGGAIIESYGLEIDDGKGGDFVSLIGESVNYLRLDFTIEKGISRATDYRMRYRARNQIGWGDYSDIVYVLSATKPQKPPRPSMISTSSTSITLSLKRSTDDGGSPITGYRLLVDAGNDFKSGFTQVVRYANFSP